MANDLFGLLNLQEQSEQEQSELLSLFSKKFLSVDKSSRNISTQSTYAPVSTNTSTYAPSSFSSTNTTSSYSPVSTNEYTYAPQIAYYSEGATLTSKKALSASSDPSASFGANTASPSVTSSPSVSSTPSQTSKQDATSATGGIPSGLDFTSLAIVGAIALLGYGVVKYYTGKKKK